MANDVTLKISPRVKAMIDSVAAEHLAETGESLTNDETIAKLVEQSNPEIYERIAAKAAASNEKKDSKASG